MSKLIVEVCRIEAVQAHPQADLLEIAVIKGWQCIIKKGSFQAGDKCVYFPIDTLLPLELSDRLGVTKYLKQIRRDYVFPTQSQAYGGRVFAARLRGVPSYGLVIACENPAWEVGQDVAEHYGVLKWEPPLELPGGDTERDHPLFHAYTDIENYKHFPSAIVPGEEVILTEKIHGTNCRLGLIRDDSGELLFMAGSRTQRRKAPPEGSPPSLYWLPMSEPVRALLTHLLGPEDRSVILFGEIFGSGVQDLHYGRTNNTKDFRAFDLALNGQYLPHDRFTEVCMAFGIATVPLLYRGPFSPDVLRQHTTGNSELVDDKHLREGVVLRPTQERFSPELCGRLILKNISDDYILRKGNATEYH